MSAYCTPYSYSREVAHRQRERERGGWGGIASIVSIGEWISAAAAAAATAATFYMPTRTQTCKYCQVLNSTKETTMQQRYYVSIAQLMRRVSTSSSISNCRLCACAGGRVSTGSVASPAERERGARWCGRPHDTQQSAAVFAPFLLPFYVPVRVLV